MKQMEDGGKIAGYFLSYANNRVSLKTMVNHELKERTREEQLAIRTKIRALLADHDEKKTLSDDAFTVFAAELLDDDRDYCEKIRNPPSHPYFMTYEDLVAEEKKLQDMIGVIVEEKKYRDLQPKIKVYKNVVTFIERNNNLKQTYLDDPFEYDLSPPKVAEYLDQRKSRRLSTCSSSSVVHTEVLTNEPSDPTGMGIVATSATAVRIAEVADEADEDL